MVNNKTANNLTICKQLSLSLISLRLRSAGHRFY